MSSFYNKYILISPFLSWNEVHEISHYGWYIYISNKGREQTNGKSFIIGLYKFLYKCRFSTFENLWAQLHLKTSYVSKIPTRGWYRLCWEPLIYKDSEVKTGGRECMSQVHQGMWVGSHSQQHQKGDPTSRPHRILHDRKSSHHLRQSCKK